MAELEDFGEKDTPRGPCLPSQVATENFISTETFSLMRSYFDEQFRALKRDLSDELQVSSSNTLKKFKAVSTSKDFKYRGNLNQFVFNSEVVADLDSIADAVKRGEQYKCLGLNETLKKKINKRNKLIRIANKSPGRWQTVQEYESDDLASNSDDDKSIKRAESRALSKQKAKQSSKPLPSPSPAPGFTPFAGGSYATFGPEHNTEASLFRGQRRQNRIFQCFACGQLGHTRPECPLQRPGPGFAAGPIPSALGSAWQFSQQLQQPGLFTTKAEPKHGAADSKQ